VVVAAAAARGAGRVTQLTFNGICKRYGGRVVLDDFCLDIQAGEVVGLLGPNGCGKSTVLNIVSQLLRADAGQVLLGGEPLSAACRARIGLCPQHSALYRDLLPAENLDFFARLHGLAGAERTRRVAELMEQFQLGPHAGTAVGKLSGGWQQRLSLAIALVHRPALLLLDEPTGAVDVQARHELWSLIEGLRASGVTLLLTTHQLAEAERLCSRVALLQSGRVAAAGTLPELLAQVPASAVAIIQTQDGAAARARAAGLGWGVRNWAGQLACLLPQPLSLGEVVASLDGLAVTSVSVQPVGLEHAYLEVMQATAV